jgi:hypothetical protein
MVTCPFQVDGYACDLVQEGRDLPDCGRGVVEHDNPSFATDEVSIGNPSDEG